MPKADTPMTEIAHDVVEPRLGGTLRRLAARAAGGPDAAFEAVFRKHWPQVYGVAFRLTGDRAEAEDLASATFWRLWERPPAHTDNLPAWLHRVAVRLGYNALRARRRRSDHERRAGADTIHAPDPAVAAELAETRARVRETLARLGDREVQLLILRHSGLSYGEIAAALGVAPTSVGTLLARAERSFTQHYPATAAPSNWSPP